MFQSTPLRWMRSPIFSPLNSVLRDCGTINSSSPLRNMRPAVRCSSGNTLKNSGSTANSGIETSVSSRRLRTLACTMVVAVASGRPAASLRMPGRFTIVPTATRSILLVKMLCAPFDSTTARSARAPFAASARMPVPIESMATSTPTTQATVMTVTR